ncbi:MAG: xanthine dehydrogenase family protein subunit M [Thermoplasmatales archaeon]
MMQPLPFEYHVPESVNEAIYLLEKYPDAKILAGGQSLIPMMKLRIASFPHLIDITRIRDLNYLSRGSTIEIGSIITVGELERIEGKGFEIIREAASQIADPLIRNMGTIGGNIAHGDPSNDMPAVMMAMKAKFVITGPKGKRVVPADRFITEPYTTILEEAEILTDIRIDIPTTKSGGSYVKQKKSAGDFSIAAVASFVSLDTSGRVKDAGIGITSVSPVPKRAEKAEKFLVGKNLDEDSIREACDLIIEESSLFDDINGSAEYKKKVLWRVARRSLINSRERALVS